MKSPCAKIPAIFMGSDPMVLPALEALHASSRLEWKAVFTQPDRPQGRGQKLQSNCVKQWAQSLGLNVIQPEKVDDSYAFWLKQQGVQVAFIMAFGQLLRTSFLEALPLGAWNLHVSVLPKYRGTSPIQSAIAQGDSYSGVSLMRIVARMDAGPILRIGQVPIETQDTYTSLSQKIAQESAKIITQDLDAILNNTAILSAQDETQATYVRKLSKEDALLNFNMPADKLARRIQAQWPWPGASIIHNEQHLKIGMPIQWDQLANNLAAAGTILGLDSNKALNIACGQGILKINFLQRPGAKMLSVSDFLRGYALPVGTVLPSYIMQPLVFTENPYRKR